MAPFKSTLLILLSLLALSACGKQDIDVDTTKISVGSGLEGTWVSPCLDNGGGGSLAMVVVFTANSFAVEENRYLGGLTCPAPADTTKKEAGTLTATGSKVMSTGETGNKYLTEGTLETATTNTQVGADHFNDTGQYPTGAFGFLGWTPGHTRDVLGVSESGQAESTSGKLVLSIDNASSPPRLWVGDDEDPAPKDADGYAENLNPFFYFEKQ